MAQLLADHLGLPLNGSVGPTVFSGVKNGKPGEGLPRVVPDNYNGDVYLVPQYNDRGFQTYQPRTN